MQRWFGISAVMLSLVACSGGREDRAVGACEKAVAQQLANRTFKLDRDDMRRHAKPASDVVLEIESTVVLDAGSSSEAKQKFVCRVQFDPANAAAEPAVTFLQFEW